MARQRNNYAQNQAAMERLTFERVLPPELGTLWKLAMVVLDNEEQLVDLINKHLRSHLDKALMNVHDFTIQDMLNGRIEGEFRNAAKQEIYDRWNTILGYRAFGS